MKIIDKMSNNPVISALIVALIISIVSLCYQWYLRPRIIMNYSGTYSTIDDATIGSLQIANLGRSVEEGMTVRILTAVNTENEVSVLINQTPTKEQIILRPDFTDVVINKLYPDDEAFISFKPKEVDTTDFTAFHFGRNMGTSRYENLEWTAEWWQINSTQFTALGVVIIFCLLLGILLPRLKDSLLNRLSREIYKKKKI